MNPGLTKTFVAGGTIEPYRFVKFGADDNTIVAAAAATDAIIGASTEHQVVSGERADAVMEGIAYVKAGGAITRGGPVTSDANGQAVAAAPAAGSNNRIGGFALASAANGDIIPVKLALGSLQG